MNFIASVLVRGTFALALFGLICLVVEDCGESSADTGAVYYVLPTVHPDSIEAAQGEIAL
jgi:hypothetical protein